MESNKEIFDRLKKGDKVYMTYGDAIKRSNEATLIVKSKNLVGKGKSFQSEKITFENVNNPTGVKYYAYKRSNDFVGFAVGDMAISNVVIKMENQMAKGGNTQSENIQERIKSKLSKSFTLPFELAVYVPSTKGADDVISNKEFKSRIRQVEVYLSDMFGGFSKTSVDGGYMSSEKGLITEDVAKVTAFGQRDGFETNLPALIDKISEWCEEWTQESMGFEFEGDLFYVEKGFKYAKGGGVEKKDSYIVEIRVHDEDGDYTEDNYEFDNKKDAFAFAKKNGNVHEIYYYPAGTDSNPKRLWARGGSMAKGGGVGQSNFGKEGTGFDNPKYKNMYGGSYDDNGLALKPTNDITTLGSKLIVTKESNGSFRWDLILENGNKFKTKSGFNTKQDAINDYMRTKFAKGGGIDNLESQIDALYSKSGFINTDFNWKLKLLEMLQDQSVEAYNIYQKLSKIQKNDVLQEQFEVDNDMGSDGDSDIETTKENLSILLEDAKNGKKYAKGGEVGRTITRVIQYANGGQAGLIDEEQMKDLSFKIKAKTLPNEKGVLLHELITIEEFELYNDLDNNGTIKFYPFHLIYGNSSLAIFDAFGVDEVAGLKRKDCEDFINNLKKQGKTEKDGAFIAGLTNYVGDKLFMFFNVERLNFKGFAIRVLPHESLHLSRSLISLFKNDWVRNNLNKPNWWEDKRATFVEMGDSNEEFFAETLERTTAIAMDGWSRVTGLQYAQGGGVEEIKTLWRIKGDDAELIKKGTDKSIKMFLNKEQKKNWRGEKSILDGGAGVETWYEDTTKEEVLKYHRGHRGRSSTDQEYAQGGTVSAQYRLVPYRESIDGYVESVAQKQIVLQGTYNDAVQGANKLLSSNTDFFYVDVTKIGKNVMSAKKVAKVYFDGVVKYDKGGSIEDENSDMVRNQNRAISHHTEELEAQLDKGKNTPAWVVSKVSRASNDLSDVTHYLEGEKMADGGEVSKEYRIASKYSKMLNDIAKEKQFNKRIQLNDEMKKFAKENGLSIDNNNIISVNGVRVAYIDKINQRTSQSKTNWAIHQMAKGGGVDGKAYFIVKFSFNGDDGYQVVESKPILAQDEDEAAAMLKDQFESLEGMSCEIISIKNQSKMAEGGGVEKMMINSFDVSQLVGKWLTFVGYGEHDLQITHARVTPEHFSQRDLFLTTSGGGTEKIPFAQAQDFINGKSVELRDTKGEYFTLTLMDTKFANGGMTAPMPMQKRKFEDDKRENGGYADTLFSTPQAEIEYAKIDGVQLSQESDVFINSDIYKTFGDYVLGGFSTYKLNNIAVGNDITVLNMPKLRYLIRERFKTAFEKLRSDISSNAINQVSTFDSFELNEDYSNEVMNLFETYLQCSPNSIETSELVEQIMDTPAYTVWESRIEERMEKMKSQIRYSYLSVNKFEGSELSVKQIEEITDTVTIDQMLEQLSNIIEINEN